MPTLNINGRRVTVGDGFLKLSSEEQNATVDEIAGHLKESAAEAKPAPGWQEELARLSDAAPEVTGGAELGGAVARAPSAISSASGEASLGAAMTAAGTMAAAPARIARRFN